MSNSIAAKADISKDEKHFVILICIIPLLMNYKSVIPSVDAATFLILCFFGFYLLKKGLSIPILPNVCSPLWWFVTLTFLTTVLSVFASAMSGDSVVGITRSLLRMVKFCVIIIIVIFCLYKDLFNRTYALKVLKTITYVAVIYQFMQVIGYQVAGVVLPRGIHSLLTYDAYGYDNFYQLSGKLYRPSSFFIEPASYVQYVLLYLTYAMFAEKSHAFKDWKAAILISISIILSGSGQGIVLVALLWILWYFIKVVFVGRPGVFTVILLVLVPVTVVMVLPYVLQLPIVQGNLERILGDNELMGYATEARLVGYEYLKDLTGIHQLIGFGYGNVVSNVYFPSVAYTAYGGGIIGFAVQMFVFVWLFFKTRGYAKVYTFIYFILIFATTSFFACNICFYFPFLLSEIPETNRHKGGLL